MRAYYSAEIKIFLQEDKYTVLGKIIPHQAVAEEMQTLAWLDEIAHLQEVLQGLEGRILFEYTIPRIGRRADVVLLIDNIVFVLEYKCGGKSFLKNDVNQVYDYALDLKNFQKESHDRLVVPILVSTKASTIQNIYVVAPDKVMSPQCCNEKNLLAIINDVRIKFNAELNFDYVKWENSRFSPTPTIIEAAQALYNGHTVEEITKHESDDENLSKTTNVINQIIDSTKEKNEKAIIFITGVPGAGKTLAGLNIVHSRQDKANEEHAVFLSGNGPLVDVLQTALKRDKKKKNYDKTKKQYIRPEALIQDLYYYRKECISSEEATEEKIIIIDEAQRMWTRDKLAEHLGKKKVAQDFDKSEPEFLISVMNRQKDWAVIICLVGVGQEIHTGEAGIGAWFESLKGFGWKVYIPKQIMNSDLSGVEDLSVLNEIDAMVKDNLHLATAERSFRSEKVSEFIRLVLENEKNYAKELYKEIEVKYPIFLTRDLSVAKRWVRSMARANERYGVIASSGAKRLRSDGIYIFDIRSQEFDVAKWFLNDKDDIMSSCMLELVASEFKIQGLELDYTVVAWDANFRYNGNGWEYYKLRGTEWNEKNDVIEQGYLKNSYRVLLTRARQGMVIFIPYGDASDRTRLPVFYDRTFNYLKEIGLKELSEISEV